MKNVDFSLILACYNEGPTFEKSISEIYQELKKLKSWEVIFVEDKSTDDTAKRLGDIAATLPSCRVIWHKKNTGRGRAVADGILSARGEICGYIDVDCEISPSYIPLFISEVQKGYEIVVASRFYEHGLRYIQRVVVSKAYSVLIKKMLNLPIDDTEAGFKFFNRVKILPILKNTRDNGWFWDTEICARSWAAGLKMSQIPVLFVRKADKKSTVKIVSDSIDYAKKLWAFRTEYSKLKKQ